MSDTTEEPSGSIDLSNLTAHLASLDLDPATLELLMAALTAEVDEPGMIRP